MGYRMHYAKTYKVEWAGGQFNHSVGDIDNLLSDMCPNTFKYECGYGMDGCDRMEVSKDELKKAIPKIRRKKRNKNQPAWLDELGYTFDDVADYFATALKYSEPNDDYIHFEWF